MERISSSRSLGALLTAARPTEGAEKGSVMDDSVVKTATATKKWITGILFVVVVEKKQTISCKLVKEEHTSDKTMGVRGEEMVLILLSVAD